jgi:hypothetical protein
VHRSLRSRRAVFGAAAAVVALCAGGAVALATSSSTSPEIAACVKHDKGALYKVTVDPAAPLQCRAGDASITWNQSGPAGPPGFGATQRFTSGPLSVPNQTAATLETACPASAPQLVSGGYLLAPAAVIQATVTEDGPVSDSVWRVTVVNDSGLTLEFTPYVMCASSGTPAPGGSSAATSRVTRTSLRS